MATKLYFSGSTTSDFGSGTNDLNLRGTAIGWYSYALATSLVADPGVGGGVPTVAGTASIEVEAGGGIGIFWYSAPLAADVTISGAINWNLWARESANQANCAINAQLEKIDGATGAVTLIDKTARATELTTTAVAVNFSETPAAGVLCKKGDRLRVRVFAAPAGTMAAGYTFTFLWGGSPTTNNSWLNLTENLTFASEPAGTTIYPTNTASAVATAAIDKEAWTSRGAGQTVIYVGSTAGWAAPQQWTDAQPGTVVDWFTQRLAPVTLGGAVRVNFWGNAGQQTAVRCEIAVVDADGSNPSIWAAGTQPDTLGAANSVRSFLIGGADKAVSDGQRLRIRFYVDDPGDQPRIATTAYLNYAGAAGETNYDTWLKFSQTLSLFVPPAKTYAATLTGGGVITSTGKKAAATAGGTTGGYAIEVMNTPNLISYWRLGEAGPTGAVDETGGQPGGFIGGVTLGASGATGDGNTGVTLNGTTGYVAVPHRAALNLGDVVTLEAWVNRDGVAPGNWNGILSKGAGGYYMRMDGTSGQIAFVRSQVVQIVVSTTGVPLTGWHHVVCTKNGATVKQYIDGVDVTGTVTNSTLVNTTNQLYIGADVYGAGAVEWFKGSIDEAAVYNVALSAADVLAHYNAAASGYRAAIMATSGLVGYWRLGEAVVSASLPQDSKGSNHASAVAGPPVYGIPSAIADGNSAMYFNNYYVSIPDHSSQSVGNFPWSIEFWAKRNLLGTDQVFLSKANQFDLVWQGSDNRLYLGNQSSANTFTANPIADTNWHHYVFVRPSATNGATRIYVDGVDATGTSAGSAYASNANPLIFGVRSPALNYPYNGSLDEIAVYNRALSASEVLAHYNAAPVVPVTTGGTVLTGGGVIAYTYVAAIVTYDKTGTASLTGGGVLTASGTAGRRAIPIAATGGGVIVATRTHARLWSQAMTGGGIVTQTSRKGGVRVQAMTGGGVIVSTGTKVENIAKAGSASLTGGGVIVATGVRQEAVAKTGTASLTGGGLIIVTRTSTRSHAVPSLTGGGVIAVARTAARRSAAVATGGGVITTLPKKGGVRAEVMTASGVITYTRAKGSKATVVATGGGVIAYAHTSARSRSQVMTASGVIVVLRAVSRTSAQVMTGSGVINYTRRKGGKVTAAVSGGGIATLVRKSARFCALSGGGQGRAFSDADPEYLQNDAPFNATYGTRFTVNTAGTITHLRYFHTTGHAATLDHPLSLWSDAGAKLATVTDVDPPSNEGDIGRWREIALGTPYAVSAGVAYRVSMLPGGTDVPAAGQATSDSPFLTIGSSGYTGGGSGTEVFPGTVYGGTWFLIDVVLQLPSGNAVTGGGRITYTYAAGAVRSGNAILTGGGVIVSTRKKAGRGTAVATGSGVITRVGVKQAKQAATATGGGVITYTGTKVENIARTGSASLTGGGTVAVTRTSTRTRAQAMTGSGVVVPIGRSSRYYAITGGSGTPEEMHADSTPGFPGSTGDYTVGMGFTANVDGTVTHVRYWHDPGHSAISHPITIWSNAGAKLATFLYPHAGPVSAWIEAPLPTPLAVTAGATYRVSVTTQTWGYYGGAYPTSLAPHLSAAFAGAGLYAAGQDQFPTLTQPANHYPIDVIFVAPAGPGAMTGGGVVTYTYTRSTTAPARTATATLTGGGVVGVQRASVRASTAVLTGAGVVVVARAASRKAQIAATGSGVIVATRKSARTRVEVVTGGGRIAYTYSAGMSRSGFASLTGGGVITYAYDAVHPQPRSYAVIISL